MESHNSLIRTLETKVNALVFLNSELRKQRSDLQRENEELKVQIEKITKPGLALSQEPKADPTREDSGVGGENLAGLKAEITEILSVIDRCIDGLNHEKNG